MHRRADIVIADEGQHGLDSRSIVASRQHSQHGDIGGVEGVVGEDARVFIEHGDEVGDEDGRQWRDISRLRNGHEIGVGQGLRVARVFQHLIRCHSFIAQPLHRGQDGVDLRHLHKCLGRAREADAEETSRIAKASQCRRNRRRFRRKLGGLRRISECGDFAAAIGLVVHDELFLHAIAKCVIDMQQDHVLVAPFQRDSGESLGGKGIWRVDDAEDIVAGDGGRGTAGSHGHDDDAVLIGELLRAQDFAGRQRTDYHLRACRLYDGLQCAGGALGRLLGIGAGCLEANG